MAKDKPQFWALLNPRGEIRSIHHARSYALVMFKRWSEYMAKRLDRDISEDCKRWGGLTWKQAYRKGWRCVKVWVYQEPRVDPERFLQEIGHAYDPDQPMPKIDAASTDGHESNGSEYFVAKSAK